MIKNLINPVSDEIDKIFSTKFTYTTTDSVPNVESNTDLTYSNGDVQKGLELTTCALFVDIRNSVKINNEHYTHVKGRIYTSFVSSVLRIAKYHHGYVRNIIGDRVMIVFEPEECFKNAVDCAVSINHVASKIIAKKVSGFKVGIGIDYGTMKVYKVGIITTGIENPENKNLVWIGNPVNFASRLTDIAGKPMEKKYRIKRILKTFLGAKKVNDEFNNEALVSSLKSYDSYDFSSIQSIDEINVGAYNNILITEEVFEGLKKQDPNRNSIKKKFWTEAHGDFRGVDKKVYQASLIWVM